VVWWQTALVALGSAVIGGVLSWFGSFLLFRSQTKARRREEAGRLVGEAMAALRELDPQVFLERLQLHERGAELMQEKAERWLRAAGGLDVLHASRPTMDEAGALAYSVIERARLVVLRMTEEVVAGRGYPNEAWWNAVLPAYQHCLDSLERMVRCLDK
jgi:hypothetical protein